MLITVFVQVQPKGHQEPQNEVGSPSLAEHLVGFELGTFRFWLQCLNPLGHTPLISVTLLLLFHSMLVAYTILVQTLYKNHKIRLQGFHQLNHWLKVLLVYIASNKKFDQAEGLKVEYQSDVSALVN